MKISYNLLVFAAILLIVDATNVRKKRQVEETSEEKCEVTSEEAQWRESCNWCRCIESGKSVCTRKGCPPALALRLRDEDECKGDARWKKDCNWCTCVNGKGICTAIGCTSEQMPNITATSGKAPGIPGPDKITRRQRNAPRNTESGQTKEEECIATSQEARWRNSCNWCRCSEKGVSFCTRKACTPALKLRLQTQKQCEGDAKWRKECNWCHCIGEEAICTTAHCVPENIVREKTEEAECIATAHEARWRESCNWCRCSEIGTSFCTRMACSPSLELRFQNEKQCEGDAKWRKKCNWCHCVGGEAICTTANCEKDSSDQQLTEKELQCEALSREASWREECNWCSCSKGQGLCTRQACIPNFEQKSEAIPECRGLIRWRKDCNWCECVNGRAVCSGKTCSNDSLSNSEGEEICQVGPEGGRWRIECNWCRCRNGLGMCTKRGCRPDFEETVLRDTPVCEGDITWKKTCNWCRCINGQAVCTNSICGKSLESEKTCTAGQTWVEKCNTCFCVDGTPHCTRRACLEDSPRIQAAALRSSAIKVSTLASSQSPSEFKTCKEGSRWRNDCNWCTCINDAIDCTLMTCLPGFHFKQDKPLCEEGSLWMQDCNYCSCADELPVCTLMACNSAVSTTGTIKEVVLPTASRQCKEGSRWRNDCNWCFCSNSTAGCTLKGCIPGRSQTGPECEGDSEWRGPNCTWCRCEKEYGVCEPMAECNEDTARVIATKKVQMPSVVLPIPSQQCKEGSQWKDDCNWCLCDNGVSICTLIGCLPGHSQMGPECEGASEWRGPNCTWCRCEKEHGICEPMAGCNKGADRTITTKKVQDRPLVLSTESRQCKEGSRWRNDCNWCFCSNGTAGCTLKSCFPGSSQIGPECEGESEWQSFNCTWCKCEKEYGVCLPMANCNENDDLKELTAPIVEVCNEGSSWLEKCNLCICTNNVKVCTQMVCTNQSEEVPEPACTEGQRWKNECNTCGCFEGEPACTEKFCLGTEADRIPALCHLPPTEPNKELCGGTETKWTFNAKTGTCEEVLYGGCGGTENLFSTKEECQTTCRFEAFQTQAINPLQNPKERCHLNVKPGPCFGFFERYAFSTDRNRCEKFLYGGCEGNQNNFETIQECYNVCAGNPPTIGN